MLLRSKLTALTLAVMLCALSAAAQALDDAKYPEWRGQWRRPPGVGIQWDPTKPLGLAQQAPLTPEYQAVLEASLADQRAGGQGTDPTYHLHPARHAAGDDGGVSDGHHHPAGGDLHHHRIFQSGPPHLHRRARLAEGRTSRPSSAIRSANGSTRTATARYDVLEVETRGMKGPRSFDASGLPLHADNQTVVKERIYLDKANRDVLHQRDHHHRQCADPALDRDQDYRREKNPIWFEYNCTENNRHVVIGKDNYYVSSDGFLMPVRKDQAPPDLKYFKAHRSNECRHDRCRHRK